MSKTNVLFLCTGNSCRSQMAEAFLHRYAGDRFDVYSAGLEPKRIHPLTRKVMDEIGFDLAGQHAKDVMDFAGRMHFGYLITVCARAEENCPKTFPDISQRLHWAFEDPAAFEGTEEEILAKFREVRDQVRAKIEAWIKELGDQDEGE